MKTFWLFILATTAALAQQAPPIQPQPDQPVLPSNWYGVSLSYDSALSPKVGGGATEASLISQSAQIYTYSTYVTRPVKVDGKWAFQSIPQSGLALILKHFGPFYLIGFGNIGVATAAASASLATSGGGIVLWKIGSTKWTVFGGYHALSTGAQGGTEKVPEVGLGRVF